MAHEAGHESGLSVPHATQAGASRPTLGAGFLLILVQLSLVALVSRELDMQTSAFRRILFLVVPGFVVHHLLPPRYRLRFFTALSIGALLVVMGGAPQRVWDPALGLPRSAAILGAGLLLIGMALLPIGFWKRVALLAAAGGLGALFRAGIVGPTSLAIVWPVLAALFMFRMFVFLYDVSTSAERPPLTRSLAYFFLIPNACCLLFPVVDFKTFWRKYYDEDALVIYQRGVRWMGRGITHLLLYRLVDQLVSVQPGDVTNGTQLIQFVVSNSLLYLKVSGQFHLIVGMLLLFGFNLPETNHRYFLASSFTDYWRRVNIYWKDFMMKVFYYPTVFRLKRLGPTWGMFVATFVAFFATWVLHLYQTWWLRGSVSLKLTDVLFWSLLGLLFLLNSLWELKRGRRRRLTTSRYGLRDTVSLTLRTAGTFAAISVLWSLWSTESLSQWLHVWSLADRSTLSWGGAVLAVVMLATLYFEVLPNLGPRAAALAWLSSPRPAHPRLEAARSALPLVAILVVAAPLLRAERVPGWLSPIRDALALGDSLAGSTQAQGRGYYESLTAVDEANRQLWETFWREKFSGYTGNDPIRQVGDFRFWEPLPLVDVEAYSTRFRTNRWGMRDRDFELARPAGTLRIALLGSSHVMGWGVPEHQVFEVALEDRLNQETIDSGGGPHFEVLNFAFNRLSPLGQISVLQERALGFAPNVVLLIAHPVDVDWTVDDLSQCLRKGIPLTPGFLAQTLDQDQITIRTHPAVAARRLRARGGALVGWSYRSIAARCRAAGALPVLAFVPLPEDEPLDPRGREQLALAAQAGFATIDLAGVFDGHEPSALLQGDYLPHMNPLAHALVADALYQRLSTDPRIDLQGRARAVLAADQALAKPSS